MEIEYAFSMTAQAQLNLDDCGNCAIEANNMDGQFWYLIIDTKLGWTQIMEYGPIKPGVEMMEDSCVCLFERLEFDKRKIVKHIDTFLNKNRRGYTPIEQSRVISRDNALNQCKSIIGYMKENKI